MVFLVYVDDGIFAGLSTQKIDQAIQELKQRYNMTDEGSLTDYLGVHIENDNQGRFHLTQPTLIQKILSDVNFQDHTKPKPTPTAITKPLRKSYQKTAPHSADWKYRSIIGKLNYLEKSTRPDIAFAVHQCARFMEKPMQEHTEAVLHICRYLKGTQDKGIILDPSQNTFELYVDADFCGNWDSATAAEDRSTALSRMGFAIKFAGCLTTWLSKLQTEVALSTTAAEYVALSHGMREVLPLMELLAEFKDNHMIQDLPTPEVRCTVFEDNSGAIELAKLPKMRPRTKYLNAKYHHFRHMVEKGMVSIQHIATELQQAGMLTKALPENQFISLRKMLMGW